MRKSVVILFLLFSATILTAQTWAEKLGFPPRSRVLILHADDVGMCDEANKATKELLVNKNIQSASVMMPTCCGKDFSIWVAEHPETDIGVHLALTSEWKNFRWGSVALANLVPSLLDAKGFLWSSEKMVGEKAKTSEVEREIRAQIDKALKLGLKPTHLDTHMGALFQRIDIARVFYKVAKEYGISPLAMEPNAQLIKKFRDIGDPITEELIQLLKTVSTVKLDNFELLPSAKSYQEKRDKLFSLIRDLSPGVTEIVFHPAVESETLKQMTRSWKQRVWEAELFRDPEVKAFLKEQKLVFTTWRELNARAKTLVSFQE